MKQNFYSSADLAIFPYTTQGKDKTDGDHHRRTIEEATMNTEARHISLQWGGD